MGFSSPLLLKGLGGLAVTSTATAVGILNRDSIVKLFQGEKIFTQNLDQEIIKILENADQDIVFKLTKKVSGQAESNLDNLDLTSNENDSIITASVTISTDTKSKKGKFKVRNSQESPVENLKKLNGGKDWTWECQIEFKKQTSLSGATKSIETTKLVDGSRNEGFFNILGKNLIEGGDSKKPEYEITKLKFVKECISSYGNRQLNDENKLISTFQIKFKPETDKIYLEEAYFNKWFVISKLTKWDEKIIDLIDKSGIVFSVNNTPDETFTNFSSEQSKTVSYTVGHDQDNFKRECIVSFSKKSEATDTELNETQKNDLIGNDGFFEKILKTDEDTKELKKKFVKNCAEERTTIPTSLNNSDNKITSTKHFSLENDENNAGKLTIKEDFDKWFK